MLARKTMRKRVKTDAGAQNDVKTGENIQARKTMRKRAKTAADAQNDAKTSENRCEHAERCEN